MKNPARVKEPVILRNDVCVEIADGAWIEVLCIQTAEPGGNTHRGQWKVYVVSATEDGEHIKQALSVNSRGSLNPRIFVTIAGLQKLSTTLGLSPFSAPTLEGETVVWVFKSSKKPDDTGGGCGCSICAAHRRSGAVGT